MTATIKFQNNKIILKPLKKTNKKNRQISSLNGPNIFNGHGCSLWAGTTVLLQVIQFISVCFYSHLNWRTSFSSGQQGWAHDSSATLSTNLFKSKCRETLHTPPHWQEDFMLHVCRQMCVCSLFSKVSKSNTVKSGNRRLNKQWPAAWNDSKLAFISSANWRHFGWLAAKVKWKPTKLQTANYKLH